MIQVNKEFAMQLHFTVIFTSLGLIQNFKEITYFHQIHKVDNHSFQSAIQLSNFFKNLNYCC